MQMTCRPQIIPLKELHRSEYSTDISSVVIDYLDDANQHISNSEKAIYSFSRELYDGRSYDSFVHEFEKLLTHHYDDKIQIMMVKGCVGTGKTSFLLHGHDQIDKHTEIIIVDFREIDEGKNVEEYVKIVSDRIVSRAENYLYDESYLQEWNNLKKTKDTSIGAEYESKMLLCFLIKTVYLRYKTPLIIAFDNIDLCNRTTRKNAGEALLVIQKNYEDLCKKSSLLKGTGAHLAFMIMKRPDTHFFNGIRAIPSCQFPKPILYKVFVHVLKESFRLSKERYINTPISAKIGEKWIYSIAELYAYFVDAIIARFAKLWDEDKRYGNIEEFHFLIVNGNIRRFFNFVAASVKNGGLMPLFSSSDEIKLYQYISFLVKGSYLFHPGNLRMDSEGFSFLSPIAMNVFDCTQWVTHDICVKNYMIYIRIMQYLEIERAKHNDSIQYSQLINDLSIFYDKRYLEVAIKKLLFGNVILEESTGFRDLEAVTRWEDIDLSSEEMIAFSTSGSNTISLYLKYLIIEPEYIFNIAVSQPFIEDKDDTFYMQLLNEIGNLGHDIDRKIKFCFSKKDAITYMFIKTLYLSTKASIEKMKITAVKGNDRCILYRFLDTYINNSIDDENSHCYKPIRRMLAQYLVVLDRKLTFETTNRDHLLLLKKEAQNFSKEMDRYFQELKEYSCNE